MLLCQAIVSSCRVIESSCRVVEASRRVMIRRRSFYNRGCALLPLLCNARVRNQCPCSAELSWITEWTQMRFEQFCGMPLSKLEIFKTGKQMLSLKILCKGQLLQPATGVMASLQMALEYKLGHHHPPTTPV